MNEALTQILLFALFFQGITIVYFLKKSFAKLEVMQLQIIELKIEIEKLKK